MKKFLFKISTYSISSFIFLNLIAFLSLYVLGNSNFYKQQFVKNGVDETKFDYVVLGSSTGLTTLDTKLIDSTTKMKGLNISIDDSGLSSHFLMLQHFYNVGKKTDRLILAVTPGDLSNSNPTVNNNDYRFSPHILDSDVYDYFQKIDASFFNKYTVSRYLPIVAVSYFNTELFYPSLVSLYNLKKRNRFDDRGNYSYPENKKGNNFAGITDSRVVVRYKNPYLFKIIDFCSAHKIRLVLYQSPIYKTKAVFPENLEVINHSDFIKDEGCFYDKIHVNSKGRYLCSIKVKDLLFR